jgi:hypothetical protein
MMNKGLCKLLPFGLSAALAIFGLCSCGATDTRISAARTLGFDVSAKIFNAADEENPGLAGLGIDTVTVKVTTDVGTVGGSVDGTAFSSTVNWQTIAVAVSGKIDSIEVQGIKNSATVVSKVFTDFDDTDISAYNGYTQFADVINFKVDWVKTNADYGRLRLLPCPRSDATPIVDSTAIALANRQTDYGLSNNLQNGEVSIHFTPDENGASGDITYDLYMALAIEDPSLFSTANYDNAYLSNPWTSNWTYDEVAVSGKTINATLYQPVKINTTPLTPGVAISGSYLSYLYSYNQLTTNGVTSITAKYALVCAVIHRGGLSVPSTMVSLPVR